MSYLKDYSPFCVLELQQITFQLKSAWYFNPYRSGPNSHLNWGGGGSISSLSQLLLQIETKKISGGSFAFLGKITFSSPSGQTSP